MADYVARATGLGPVFAWTWKVLQWPVVLALVALGAGMVYYFAPDAEQEWVWVTPGSVLATVLWLLASLGFKYYVTNFGTYTETYGAIGGVMVLLLWFYISGLVMLLGAELNAEIEHASPYGKAVGEKVPGQRRAIGALACARYLRRPAAGHRCRRTARRPSPRPSRTRSGGSSRRRSRRSSSSADQAADGGAPRLTRSGRPLAASRLLPLHAATVQLLDQAPAAVPVPWAGWSRARQAEAAGARRTASPACRGADLRPARPWHPRCTRPAGQRRPHPMRRPVA